MKLKNLIFVYDYINGQHGLKYRMTHLENAIRINDFNKQLFMVIEEDLKFRSEFLKDNTKQEGQKRVFNTPELEEEFKNYMEKEVEFTNKLDLMDSENICGYDIEVLDLLA